MKVLMFQPWKAALVESGASRQTIRPTRKRPINVGDELSLRTWRGKPYQSKQHILGKSNCSETFPIKITGSIVEPVLISYGHAFSDSSALGIAEMDGFPGLGAMMLWFDRMYGLPFYGTVIRW